jgi:hypothetical protein
MTPCPARGRTGEACWRDTPLMAGQARLQMSRHDQKWWGYRWANKVKFQPESL